MNRKRKSRKERRMKKLPKGTELPSTEISNEHNESTPNKIRKVHKIQELTINGLNNQEFKTTKPELRILPTVPGLGRNKSLSQYEQVNVIEDRNTQSGYSFFSQICGDISSGDENEFLSYNNVVDVFDNGGNSNNYAEIVSVDMNTGAGKAKLKKAILSQNHVNKSSEVDQSDLTSDSDDCALKQPTNIMRKCINGSRLCESEVHCANTKEGTVVALVENATIYLHGLCLLSVLHGEIEILGYQLNANSPEVEVYSPRGTSLLFLKNITQSASPVASHLKSVKFPNQFRPTERCAIVLCKKLDDPKMSLIEKHISQQILPKCDNPSEARVVFQPSGSWNLLNVNEDWDRLIEQVTESTKMLICGGKGVGKTTFLRFAINRLLMKYHQVRVIDLDPGQSEFTIPGCISVVKVTNPFFGPNYTHLQPAEKSFLSNINIEYEADKYVASVKLLADGICGEVPTLINCMGYTHGLGINILSAVIAHLQPSDVVQITSSNAKKNYKFLLETQVVQENAKLFGSMSSDLNYKLHQIDSMNDENENWTAESRQLREMCVLSGISGVIDCNSVFKSKSLYKIDLDDVIITDLQGEKIHVAAINGGLVALCSLEDEDISVFRCLSWGIVKGIDLEAKHLVIMTSQRLEILNNVTHLVTSGATLPPSVYMTPDHVTGSIPYVIDGFLMSFGQMTKRSRLPVNK